MIPAGGAQGRQSLESTRVQIVSVGADGRCLTRDTLGRDREVLYSLRPKGVGRPAAGEIWVLHRMAADTWVLGPLVGAPEPPTITGAWVDQSTAGPALLAALAGLGLVVDATTGGAGGTALSVLLGDLDDRITALEGLPDRVTALEALTAGMLRRVAWTQSTGTASGIAGTETFFSPLQTSATLVSGRRYWALAYLRLTAATNSATWTARIRHSGTGSAPTTGSAVVGTHDGNHQITGGGGQQTVLVGGDVTAASTTSVFGVSVQRSTGSGTLGLNPPTDGEQWFTLLEVV